MLAARPTFDGGPRPITSFGSPELKPRDLRLIIEEYEKQMAVTEAQASMTAYAMRQMTELHSYGYATKVETLNVLQALDSSVSYTSPFDQMHAQHTREQLVMYVDHIHKALQLGAKNIAIEIDRSLYPPPPPKPGLIARLLGISEAG